MAMQPVAHYILCLPLVHVCVSQLLHSCWKA